MPWPGEFVPMKVWAFAFGEGQNKSADRVTKKKTGSGVAADADERRSDFMVVEAAYCLLND